MLGTVYSSAGGDLSNSAMAGYSDVTAAFEADANAAIADWQRADLVPFTLTTQITLANLGSEQAAGDSLVTSSDPATGLPLTSQIRIDDSVGDPTYVQANPYDNSQFTASTQSTTINGNDINIGRIYQGAPGGPADGQNDLLTLFLHEFGHSLGFSDGVGAFDAAVTTPGSCDGSANTANNDRTLTIPTSVSGLATSTPLPILCASPHFDGTNFNGVYNNSLLAEPGFALNIRLLPSEADILGVCTADGATAAQCNTNPNFGDPNGTTANVPEPGSIWLVLTGAFLVMLGVSRKGGQFRRGANGLS